MKTVKTISLVLVLSASYANAAISWGVTNTNNLVSFNNAAPGSFLSSFVISGLVASDGVTPDPGAYIANLSFNSTNGRFIGIDSNSNIYNVNFDGSTSLINSTFAPAGFNAGLAFDSFTNGFIYADDAAARYNIASSGNATFAGSAFYGIGDANQSFTPSIMGVGIDPDFGSAFFLDFVRGTLARSFDPAALELSTVGSLGVTFTGFGDLSFDADGNLLASLSTNGLDSALYSINQATGEATMIGSFSQGIGTFAVPEPSSALLGAIGALALFRRRRA